MRALLPKSSLLQVWEVSLLMMVMRCERPASVRPRERNVTNADARWRFQLDRMRREGGKTKDMCVLLLLFFIVVCCCCCMRVLQAAVVPWQCLHLSAGGVDRKNGTTCEWWKDVYYK